MMQTRILIIEDHVLVREAMALTLAQVCEGVYCEQATNATDALALLEANPNCDLLVVDELGPLELVRGEGWQAALEALAQGGYCLALVVVRPELLDVLPAAWHIQRVVDLDCQPAGD